MKRLLALLASGILVLSLTACDFSFGGDDVEEKDEPVETEETKEEPEEEKSSISTDEMTYDVGADIEVAYELVDELGDSAWAGIVPSDTAHGSENDGDDADVSYQYLNGSIGGTLDMTAPKTAGEWDVRIYSSDGADGVELVSTSFTVEGEATTETDSDEDEEEESTLSLPKTSYTTGEEVVVTFTASADFDTGAWVGLIPSDVAHGTEEENDANDVAYEYINGETSGTMTFTAPSEPGSWDLRMNDGEATGSLEVTSVTFTVVGES